MPADITVETWQDRNVLAGIVLHVSIACQCGEDMLVVIDDGVSLDDTSFTCDGCGGDYLDPASGAIRAALVLHRQTQAEIRRWN